MSQKYRNRNVRVLIIDVMEDSKVASDWAKHHGFSFPVLHDAEGEVSTRYAPEEVLPDLPRDQVPIASNLIIDSEGKIQFYTLLDSRNFDAKLIALQARLDELLAQD